jgi:glutaredoxin
MCSNLSITKFLSTNNMTKVYRFTASWCQPCKALAKVLEAENINIEALDIDSAEAKPLMALYNIRSVPTIVIDAGEGQITKFTGAGLSSQAKDTIRDALV